MKNLSRKEAITILESMRIDIPVPKAAVTQRKRNVALDMAISALSCSEMPNSSDTISRQAAIDAICRSSECESEFCGIPCTEVNALKALPSVQSEQRWIPCSERLPENGRQVLVYARSVHYALAKYDEMREADGTYKKQWVTFDAWKPYYTIKEVIAWMPLPEPYKEDNNG